MIYSKYIKIGMTEMLRLSAEVHEKIIGQAVVDVTDEEVDEITYSHPTFNPIYYPEWFDMSWSMMIIPNAKDLDDRYTRFVMRVMNSSNPIRLIILEKLSLFDSDDDEYLLDFRINKCMEDHRRLVREIRDPTDSDDESLTSDIEVFEDGFTIEINEDSEDDLPDGW